MGKRRTNLEHKNRYEEEEESEDEIIDETPLNEDQKAEIQSRKKLVAKRRVGAGIESSISTPSPFSFLSKPSTEEKTNPPVFSGFKGFTAFKPTPSTTSVESKTSTEASNSSILKFSFDKKDSTESLNQPSIINGSKPESELISSKSASATAGSDAQSDKTELTKNKNINENELKFIKELNDLYERCYGANKRSYKLPFEALDESGESSDQETKYACLLAELNRHISKWITKHVEESPLVLLTPVFVDYFNYLILLEKHFFPGSFKENEKISESSDKLTNGTKLPVNGMNGHKDSAERPEVIIEDKAKENQDVVDASKKIAFKSANLPFTPISLDTNKKEEFKFGSIASSDEEKSSFFKKNTMETKEIEKTPTFTNQITFAKMPTNFETTSKTAQDQKTETSQSKTLFGSFSENVQSSTSLFSFSSNNSTVSGNIETKNDVNSEKKEEKKGEDESKKFSFTPTTGGFFSTLKKNENESVEKKEETKSNEESKKFSFGQTPGGIFSSLKKIEEASEESKEKPSDTSSSKLLTTTPFSFSTTPLTGAPKSFFSFTSSEKPSIFSSTSQSGEPKSIFGSTPISFGSGVSFGSAAPAASGDAEGEEEPYEPPKPESSNVKEEGSVYEKRMKLYYFSEKEKKFVDRGIGNLFIKPTKDGESTQLIIRADTTLANILLNVKLSKVFPISKMGPKDVSYLCVPNPEIPGVSNTSPCKFLFKVKTPEDADELLEKLNEYKK